MTGNVILFAGQITQVPTHIFPVVSLAVLLVSLAIRRNSGTRSA